MLTIVCSGLSGKNVYYSMQINKKQEILIKFGSKVREQREFLNLSQEELAERAKLHRTYIGMIERAEKNITLLNIEKISKALSIKISKLFED